MPLSAQNAHMKRHPWLWFGFFLVASACASPQKPAPAKVCEPEIRQSRRAIELVPLVVVSPQLNPEKLNQVRARFVSQLKKTGAFELVDANGLEPELVVSAVISESMKTPSALEQNYSLPGRQTGREQWALRLLIEVRAKFDMHLIAVLESSAQPGVIVPQNTGVQIESSFANAALRQAIARVTRSAAIRLAGNFGPAVDYVDPAVLETKELVRLAKDYYACGAYDLAVGGRGAGLEVRARPVGNLPAAFVPLQLEIDSGE